MRRTINQILALFWCVVVLTFLNLATQAQEKDATWIDARIGARLNAPKSEQDLSELVTLYVHENQPAYTISYSPSYHAFKISSYEFESEKVLKKDWCQQFDNLGFDRVRFDKSNYAFIGLPDNLLNIAWLWLYEGSSPEQQSGFGLQYSKGVLVITPFYSLVADGQPFGNHDFCAQLLIPVPSR